MSEVATETHAHRAKDGCYYKSYDEKVKANIRANEQFLKDKGLDHESMAKIRNAARKTMTPPKKRPAEIISPSLPSRRSTRLQKQQGDGDNNNDSVEADLDSMDKMIEKQEELAERQKKRARKARIAAARELSPEDRRKLENVPAWVETMHEYLLKVEHVSYPNARTVMRQVGKLVSGIGVDYDHWDGNIFMPGVAVNMTMDFVTLLEDAKEWENRYGRDRGNGWAIRHPLKKLANYQQYLLEEKENA